MKQMRQMTPFGVGVTEVLRKNRFTTAGMARELGLRVKFIRDAYYGFRPAYEYQQIIADFLKNKFGADIPVASRENRPKITRKRRREA